MGAFCRFGDRNVTARQSVGALAHKFGVCTDFSHGHRRDASSPGLAWAYRRRVGRRDRVRDDCAWRVEVVKRGRTRWYRISTGDDELDWLSIGAIQSILSEAGVDLAGALVRSGRTR